MIAALSEPVQAAIATGLLAGTIPAVVSSLASRRRAAESDEKVEAIDQKIGTPNGQGNVVEMMQQILAGQTGQDARLAKHDALIADHGSRITALEQRSS